MRQAPKIAFAISGIGLLLWPPASFFAIFILDAPFRSGADEAIRTSLVGAVWSYGIVWALARKFTTKATERKAAAPVIIAWIAAPYAWIIMIATLASAWS